MREEEEKIPFFLSPPAIGGVFFGEKLKIFPQKHPLLSSYLYLKYIQQLSIQERLELISMLVNSTLPSLPKKPAPEKSTTVMDFAGVGKAYAMKKDAHTHVRQLRSEWD